MIQELQIIYGFHATPFGECLIGITERGICSLYFGEREIMLETLKAERPNAIIQEDFKLTQNIVGKLTKASNLFSWGL